MAALSSFEYCKKQPTDFQSYTTASYEDLVATFGEPNYPEQWYLKFNDGTIACIEKTYMTGFLYISWQIRGQGLRNVAASHVLGHLKNTYHNRKSFLSTSAPEPIPNQANFGTPTSAPLGI